jgi:hypothetical protein
MDIRSHSHNDLMDSPRLRANRREGLYAWHSTMWRWLYGVDAVPPPIFCVMGRAIGGGTASTPYKSSGLLVYCPYSFRTKKGWT